MTPIFEVPLETRIGLFAVFAAAAIPALIGLLQHKFGGGLSARLREVCAYSLAFCLLGMGSAYLLVGPPVAHAEASDGRTVVTITSLSQDQVLDTRRHRLEGTATNLAGAYVYAVVRSEEVLGCAGRMGSYWPQGGPAHLNGDRWVIDPIFLGDDNTTAGARFRVVVGITDREGHIELQHWLQEGDDGTCWDPLAGYPDGFEPLAAVWVSRG